MTREERLKTAAWLREQVEMLKRHPRYDRIREHVKHLDRAVEELVGPGKFPVYCAWCLAEGRKNVVNWSETEHSHGICAEHREALRMEAEIRMQKRKWEELCDVV